MLTHMLESLAMLGRLRRLTAAEGAELARQVSMSPAESAREAKRTIRRIEVVGNVPALAVIRRSHEEEVDDDGR